MLLRTTCSLLLSVALTAANPVLWVDRFHHAFGDVRPTRLLRTTFLIRNQGDSVLELANLESTCGCTSGSMDKKSLHPNESATIELVFDPRHEKGRIEGALIVASNDPVQPQIRLSFEAEVVLPVVAAEEAVFFPDTLPHDRTTRKVRVRSTVDMDLNLVLQSVPPPFLNVAIAGEKREAKILVTMDGSKLPKAGGVEGKLLFATGIPERPELTLEYYGFAGHAIEAQPEGLAFDPEKTGKPQSFVVKLRDIRNRPFRVVALQTVPPPFKAEMLTHGSAVHHELAVSLAASVPSGSYSGSVILKVENPDQEEVEIKVTANLQ